MKLSELQNGEVVRLRRGRAGREAVEWGPWESQEIYGRFQKAVKKILAVPKEEIDKREAEYQRKRTAKKKG